MKTIVAVDQSTSSSKAILLGENGEILRKAGRPHHQYYPAQGRAEHDAGEIFANVVRIIDEVLDGIELRDVAAIALTNQRETAVLWDRKTGEPVCPAIVWQDTRGEGICRELMGQNDVVLRLTGSNLSPYLPASKVAQLFREQPQLKRRAKDGELCFGTIESYLASRLNGGEHVADVSNASRSQLMNLETKKWDQALLTMFDLPSAMLAEKILPCDGDFGEYKGIPITGVLGDSFATLFGQGCHEPGTVKTSYGTGTSVMMNLGDSFDRSPNGLTTAIAYQFKGRTAYEMEGNITCSGDTLVWLCRELEWFSDVNEIETLARSVKDSGGVHLVPAMAGLGAPFFDTEARAMICGMSRGTTRAHIARAALESMAQRGADVFEALEAATGRKIERLMVDGGGARDGLLMQLQSDLMHCRLECTGSGELSALGAAYMAGLTQGVFECFESIPGRMKDRQVYIPEMEESCRAEMRNSWKNAIRRVRMRSEYA